MIQPKSPAERILLSLGLLGCLYSIGPALAQEKPQLTARWELERAFNKDPRPLPSGSHYWYLSRQGGYLMTPAPTPLASPSRPSLSRPLLWKLSKSGGVNYLYELPESLSSEKAIEDPYLLVHDHRRGLRVWHIEDRRKLAAPIRQSSFDWRWLSKTRLLEIAGDGKTRLRVWRWKPPRGTRLAKLTFRREIRMPSSGNGARWFSRGGKWVYQINFNQGSQDKAWRIDLDSGAATPFPELPLFLQSTRGKNATNLQFAPGLDWAVMVSISWARPARQVARVTLFRFDLQRGQPLPPVVLRPSKGSFPGHRIAFSPDGKRGLLHGPGGNGATYFDLASGKPICRLVVPPQMEVIQRLVVHPRWPLAIVSSFRRLAIFDLESGKLRYLNDADHLYRVTELTFLDNRRLASLDGEGRVLLRDIETGRIEPLVQGLPAYQHNLGQRRWISRGMLRLPRGSRMLMHFRDGANFLGPIRTILVRPGMTVTRTSKKKHLVFTGKPIGFRDAGKRVLVNPRPFRYVGFSDDLSPEEMKRAPTQVLVYDTKTFQLQQRLEVGPYLRAWVLDDRLLALTTFDKQGAWWIEGRDTSANKTLWRIPLARFGLPSETDALPLIRPLALSSFLLAGVGPDSQKSGCWRIASRTGTIRHTFFKGRLRRATVCRSNNRLYLYGLGKREEGKELLHSFDLATNRKLAASETVGFDQMVVSPDGTRMAISQGAQIKIYRRKKRGR